MQKKQVIIFVILLAIIIAAIYGWNEYHRTNKSLSGMEAAYTVQADSLITEFEGSDSVTEKKYLGKTVAVSGTIKKIEKDADGYYTVVLGPSSAMSSVRCSMDTTVEISALREGGQATIKGSFTGYQKDETGLLGSDIKLNRCVIDLPKKE